MALSYHGESHLQLSQDLLLAIDLLLLAGTFSSLQLGLVGRESQVNITNNKLLSLSHLNVGLGIQTLLFQTFQNKARALQEVIAGIRPGG